MSLLKEAKMLSLKDKIERLAEEKENETENETEETGEDYSDLTKDELKEKLDEFGIEYEAAAKKASLLRLLKKQK